MVKKSPCSDGYTVGFYQNKIGKILALLFINLFFLDMLVYFWFWVLKYNNLQIKFKKREKKDSIKGFIKDSLMGENTRLLNDLIHYLEENNKTGILLLFDFEKAFDSLNRYF